MRKPGQTPSVTQTSDQSSATHPWLVKSSRGYLTGKFLSVGTLTTATLALLLAEFPFGTLAVEQYRQIFAGLCQAAGRPYAREVANRALCDAINDRGVAHPVSIKFLQSLNGPAKMHPPTFLFMSL